jgi:serine/threonine-protein kinase RsbW
VEVSLSLSLPRDAMSVPIARRVAVHSLRSVGFVDDDVWDAEIAIAEACSNVVSHCAESDPYEVRMQVTDATLFMEVVDAGHGFDGVTVGHEDSPGTAESGRGIQLMRAMVDDVRFAYLPGRGNVVSMSKVLRYHDDSVQARLLGAGPHPAHGDGQVATP